MTSIACHIQKLNEAVIECESYNQKNYFKKTLEQIIVILDQALVFRYDFKNTIGKRKTCKWYNIKIKYFHAANDTMRNVEGLLKEWEDIFANHISEKGS